MSSLNRFFLCSCVFIFVSKIYGWGGPFAKLNNVNYSIDNSYYYFDFKFSDDSIEAGNGYYYEQADKITTLWDSKKYYIDNNYLYSWGWSNYQIIRKRKYKLGNEDEIKNSFYEKINDSYKEKFETLINNLKKNTYFYKGFNLSTDFEQIINIEYDQNNNTFKLKLKSEIPEKYKKTAANNTTAAANKPTTTTTTTTKNENTEPKKVEIESATAVTEHIKNDKSTAANQDANTKQVKDITNKFSTEETEKIFTNIVNKYTENYEKSYSDINNVADEKLNKTEEEIKNEITTKINEILTEELNLINEEVKKNEIKTGIESKFNDNNINTKVNTIVNIINKKREELKIKFIISKKNTEDLKDKYSESFTNIINKYKDGIYENITFEQLRSEITENKDIKLYVNNSEVDDYNQNITRDSNIVVEFPKDYLKIKEKPDKEEEKKGEGNENKTKCCNNKGTRNKKQTYCVKKI